MTNKSLSWRSLLLLLILPSFVHAQPCCTPLHLTFDTNDTVYQQAVIIDTVSHLHNSWQIGRPGKVNFDSAHSGLNAIVTDTLNPYPVNDTSVFILGLRNYMHTSSWWHAIDFVNFYYKMDVDTGSKGIIEYSVDTGHTWHPTSIGSSSDPDTVTFTHSITGWQSYSIQLYSHICDSLLLRFTFISDTDSSTHDGWMIDDIYVSYWSEDVPNLANAQTYLMYPNPVADKLVIEATNKISTLIIYNTLGQTVYQDQYTTSKIQVNISELPPGIYFAKINGSGVKRFVKE